MLIILMEINVIPAFWSILYVTDYTVFPLANVEQGYCRENVKERWSILFSPFFSFFFFFKDFVSWA